MKLTNNWETLSFYEEDKLYFINLRLELDAFRSSKKLKYCIEINYPYEGDDDLMPKEEDSAIIAEIYDRLNKIMEKDKLAIHILNITGNNRYSMTFAARHLPSFGERLNEALKDLPKLNLSFDAIEDENWEEYSYLLAETKDTND